MFKDCGSYFMYVPENVDSTLNVAIYYPGAGGAYSLNGNDAIGWVDYVEKYPNQVVIINKGCSDNSATIFGDLNDSGLDYGVVNVYCHSLGDVAGRQTAANAADYGFDANFLSVMDSNSQLATFEKMSPEEARKLADNNTTVVLFNQRDWAMDANRTRVLTDAGVPLMYITCKTDVSNMQWNDTNHALINAQPIQNGYPSLLTGEISSLPIEDTPVRGSHQILEYEFNWYDYDTNSWVSLTQEQAETTLAAQGRSLSAVLSTLPYQANSASPVNLANVDIRFNLEAAVGNLPSRDSLVLYSDELSAFLGSSMLSGLTTDASESSNLINLINGFISNTTLKGESWNMAYTKLGVYNDMLNERITAANELGETLRSAVSALLSAMNGYSKVDTSELETLKQLVIQLTNQIEILKQQLWKEEKHTDKYGNTTTVRVKDEGVEREIIRVEHEKEEAEKMIKTIEKVQQTYDSVRPQLEGALAKVSAFSSKVASVTPSPSYTYVA